MENLKRRKIAVFMADLQSEYHHKTMEGIIKQANYLNYDVLSFSFFSNHLFERPFQTGEENIFKLFNAEKVDGIILYETSFRREAVRKMLTEICEKSGIPYIKFDEYDNDDEYKIWNDREIFKKLVSHFIEVHSFKKIYCLTGFEGMHQSENRLEGYRDAMREHGLKTDKRWEFYGDFWEEAPKNLAEKIISGEIEKPEAIVCANCAMAITITNVLNKNGINVPDDIAVGGYDSYIQNAMNTPTVTAMSNINYNQGIYAVCRLNKLITGENCIPFELAEEMVEPAESCGCSGTNSKLIRWYKEYSFELSHYTDLIQVSNMMQEISAPENLNDFIMVLSRFSYLVRGAENIYLCICDDWDGITNIEKGNYRIHGYSDNMLLFHIKGKDNEAGIIPKENSYIMFSSKEMCPVIYNSPRPSAYYFIPLHFEDRCFGYVVVEFKQGQYSFDKQLWTWTDNISTALETIRIRNYIRRFSERVHLTAIRDPMTGIYNRRGFEELSSEMFEQAIINKEKFLLIAIDINNLNKINHEYGFTMGDEVIMSVAEAISNCCRANEICCRCGEDNFYVIGCMNYTDETVQERIDSIHKNCSLNIAQLSNDFYIELDTGFYCEKICDNITLVEIINRVDKIIEQKRFEQQKRIDHFKSFTQLRKQIYAQPQKRWNVEELAQMMLLSRAYFQRLYKKEFGISVMADVIAARIILAKRLLSDTTDNISEIAAACGYDSEIYFMQQFKKETDMTPTQYRKSL